MACVAVAALALSRLAAALRAGEAAPGLGRPNRLLPFAAVATLLAAAMLSAFDVWQNVVVRRYEAIALESWAWVVFDLGLPVLGLLLLRALRERDAALHRLAAEAITDPLTGLRNRRGFHAEAAAALARCARAGQPASLLSLDLDRFKSINDRHGHAAGDEVLRGLAAVMRSEARAGDLAARLGGEEFVLLLPDTDLDAALALAERLRAALPLGVPHPGGGRVTASFGLAPIADSLDAALAAADEALYAAKAAGRDRVLVAGQGQAAA
jgi:diguanylate cyclase (GGDEF)-like protein